jgi:hypothetical protein
MFRSSVTSPGEAIITLRTFARILTSYSFSVSPENLQNTRINISYWAPGAPGPAFRTWGTTNFMRANSERLPHRRCLQIISPLRRTIILRSFPSNRPGMSSSRRLPALGAPGPSPLGTGEITLNQPEEAETAYNSFRWTILQGTSLFSRFYSATLSVSSRKQGICIQNTGGGRWETTNLMRANSEQLAPPQGVGVPDVSDLSSYQDQRTTMPISGSRRNGLLLFPLPRAYHGQSENLRL